MTGRSSYPGKEVRLAVPDEAAQIASVLLEAFEEYRSLYTPEAFAATTPTPHQILARWHEGPVWVAMLGSSLVGTVAAVSKRDAMYLRSMALQPAARGHGLGNLLLEAVESHAIQHGHPRIFLSTTPFLHSAIRLYENSGFNRIDEGPTSLEGTSLFTMAKLLR